MGKHLIDIAYEYAKEKYGKNSFTFSEMFQGLLDSKIVEYGIVSDLYTDLMQDIRFISLGKQKWSLREFYTWNDINKITSSMFGLDEVYEADLDEYVIPTEEKDDDMVNEEDFLDDEEKSGSLDSKKFYSEDEFSENVENEINITQNKDEVVDEITEDVEVDVEDDDEMIQINPEELDEE